MKSLFIIFIFYSISLSCQKDTIFIKDKPGLPCNITSVKDDKISYYVGSAITHIVRISITSVSSYVKDGIKRFPELERQLKLEAPLKDTLINEASVSINKELHFIKECLRKHSRQYYTGFTFVAIGYAAAGVGIALSDKYPNKTTNLIIGGAAISLIGHLVMINSHKWFKKAALGISGTELYVKYRLD